MEIAVDDIEDLAWMSFARRFRIQYRGRPLCRLAGEHIVRALLVTTFFHEWMQMHQQSAERGNRLGRISMCLHDQRIGKDSKQRVEFRNMPGILEQPTL